ncbi:SpoIIE family protein phosphatase [Actinoplanes sp. NPDC049316]|uniref:SpoIIE family protein phosphatase n=1 Tax=Actinoplanes sp. NPDC049316 TaxID=3154727 RepID=UPI003440F5A2
MTDLFAAAGTLREAYERVDWAATPLGPVHGWSPALRSALDLALRSRAPVTLLWGPQFVLVYNEAYVDMIGDKHPAALGAPSAEVFAEIWHEIGPMLRSVADGAGATWVEDMRLLMGRRGFLEETYFTFSYSAVHGRHGEVEGVIDIATETTAFVLGRRRLELLSVLNDRLADLDDVPGLLDRALPVLRAAPQDLSSVEVLLPGEAGTAPAMPDGDVVIEDHPGGRRAWVRLAGVPPLRGNAMLVAGLSPHLAVDEAYLGFIRFIGTALSQGLNRIRARQAERHAATLQREMAEALQRSLLVPPVQPDHLRVAVRYQPAAEGAQIGGDWYDSFVLPDGRLTIVVGDVTGHDRYAAAAMSQVRNLLRGISYAKGGSPAGLLTALDDAMAGFRVGMLATCVLAAVEQDEEQAARGVRTLRWSNAGHPPPVLLLPDGSARLLQTRGEVLLGTHLRPARTEHTVELPPGAMVVFYTDGLIERRGAGLDEGIAQLVRVLHERAHPGPEEVCDHLLDHFLGATEDDVVLTVLHARPQE